MQENKRRKAKLQTIFALIGVGLFFLVDLYAMINMPGEFLIIGVLGILLLIGVYLVVDGVLTQIAIREALDREQYDSIFKSQKASYLLLKKYFEEFEERFDLLEKISKVPTEEIVGTQKGIGKVIISRSRENAEAVMSSNEQLMEEINHFSKVLSENNANLLEGCRGINADTVAQILAKQQDLLMGLKDMEIRLNNAIAQKPVYMTAPTPPTSLTPQMMAAPVSAPVETAPVTIPEPIPEPVPELIPEELAIDDVVSSEEELSSGTRPLSAQELLHEIEMMVEAPADSVGTIPVEAPITEEERAAEEPAPVPTPIAEEALVAPEPDLSDPNKKMSPEEIAALFASMSGDSEPVAEAEEPAPVVEETPTAPEPDLSDPNKKMSPDEIAALFASMSGDSEPVAEAEEPAPVAEETPVAPEPDLSDPNKKMSPEEIAALFASMGT